eukprot:SAG31_NODE_2198_length_6212_cov_3.843096_5_plen_252_part_00
MSCRKAIHSIGKHFGATDLGASGMACFFQSYIPNAVSDYLKLPRFDLLTADGENSTLNLRTSSVSSASSRTKTHKAIRRTGTVPQMIVSTGEKDVNLEPQAEPEKTRSSAGLGRTSTNPLTPTFSKNERLLSRGGPPSPAVEDAQNSLPGFSRLQGFDLVPYPLVLSMIHAAMADRYDAGEFSEDKQTADPTLALAHMLTAASPTASSADGCSRENGHLLEACLVLADLYSGLPTARLSSVAAAGLVCAGA